MSAALATVDDDAHVARRLATRQIRAAAIWLTVFLAFQLFFGEIGETLTPFIAAPLLLLIVGIGLLIGLFGLCRAFIARAQWRSALLVALALPMAWIATGPLQWAALYARFLVERPGYERVIAQIAHDPAARADLARRNYRRIRVDEGPPLRIAFVTWESIPDPWGGIVYDPSHGLERAEPHARLFDSNLRGCTHLSGAYYRCNFS